MKTIKITLITALISLGAISFGQAYKVQYLASNYTEQGSKFENLHRNFPGSIERTKRDGYKEPVVYMSYTIKQADVIYEEQFDTEAWMTSPFECGVAEADLVLEDWMSSPFESRYADADLAIENWMTSPFKSTYAEAELILEDWMTSPFEAGDYIEIESWMTAAF
jgi:hypothetical protein